MIVLLTYDVPHRKTQDVLFKLLADGHKDVHVVGTPWEQRKARRFIYAHRPHEEYWPCEPMHPHTSVFRNLGVSYGVVPRADLPGALDLMKPEAVVVGGAGILPDSIVLRHKVLNVHPGLLPRCRGLDILKWSIIEGLKVGVTAHLCDERADLGWLVMESVVPVYHSDTFHSFAMRQYEMENELIVPALGKVLANEKEHFERIFEGDTVSRRRMPRKVEAELLPAFERYKLTHGCV